MDSVDRQKTAPNNLLCYVIAANNLGQNFRLGCAADVLNRWYYSNAFQSSKCVADWTIANIPKRDLQAKFTKANPDPNKYVKKDNVNYVELTVR